MKKRLRSAPVSMGIRVCTVPDLPGSTVIRTAAKPVFSFVLNSHLRTSIKLESSDYELYIGPVDRYLPRD